MLFKDIFGHENIKRRLIKSVTNNRVSHAQLFLGAEGCGKFALSIAYARYICCTDKQEFDACGVCKSCQKYNKLEHPDLHFFFPNAATTKVKKPSSKSFLNDWRAFVKEKKFYISLSDWYSEINIENKQGIINAEDALDIIKVINLKSYESAYKIIIIYMAEKFYHASAPKLLKAFEEPPERTVFLLIAENQDAILKTILSRVQLVKVPKHAANDVLMFLKEHKSLESQDAAIISKIVDGNIVEAIRMADNTKDVIFYFENFANWMRLCYTRNFSDLIVWIDEMAKKTVGREKLKKFFTFSLRMARNSLLINLNSSSIMAVPNNEAGFLEKFHPFINERNILTINEEFNKALYHVERNINPKMLFMDLSFKMMKLLRL